MSNHCVIYMKLICLSFLIYKIDMKKHALQTSLGLNKDSKWEELPGRCFFRLLCIKELTRKKKKALQGDQYSIPKH